VAAIDCEIGIGGDQDRVGQRFGHANQAGVCQAHWNAGVFGSQVKYWKQLVRKIERKTQVAASQVIQGKRWRAKVSRYQI
jgi:hypothetical protein